MLKSKKKIWYVYAQSSHWRGWRLIYSVLGQSKKQTKASVLEILDNYDEEILGYIISKKYRKKL